MQIPDSDSAVIWFARLDRAREANDTDLQQLAMRKLHELGIMVKYASSHAEPAINYYVDIDLGHTNEANKVKCQVVPRVGERVFYISDDGHHMTGIVDTVFHWIEKLPQRIDIALREVRSDGPVHPPI